jgi:hypothetical protein
MSLPTAKHGLIKAAEGEPYDLDVVNNNLDQVDAKLPYLEGPDNLNMGTGWQGRGSGFATPSVYKDGNYIKLRGSITNSGSFTVAAGTEVILATMPNSKYNVPAGKAIEVRLKFRHNTTYAMYEGIVICSDGNVRMYMTSGITGLAAQSGTISFDGIEWLAI